MNRTLTLDDCRDLGRAFRVQFWIAQRRFDLRGAGLCPLYQTDDLFELALFFVPAFFFVPTFFFAAVDFITVVSVAAF